MLKLRRTYILLIVISLSLSSCLQLIEEINLTNSGSGNTTLTINMSSAKTKIAAIMLLDSINGYKVPSKKTIAIKTDEVVAYLRTVKGISNVSKKLDFENFIASVSFSFDNVACLNSINRHIFKELKINTPDNSSYSYSPAARVFQRRYTYTKEAAVQYNKLKPEAKNVFKEGSFTSIYRFDNAVSSVSNPLTKVSKSKKAVMLKTGMMGLISGKTNISNTITLLK